MHNFKVDEIALPPSIADHYSADEPFNSLTQIKRLNVIIGPNNTGKSRLLRAMFLEGASLQVSTNDEDALKVRSSIRAVFTAVREQMPHRDAIVKSLNANLYMAFHSCGDPLTRNPGIPDDLGRAISSAASWAGQTPASKTASEHLQQMQQGLLSLVRRSKGDGKTEVLRPLNGAKFVYIPTLRGMRIAFEVQENGSIRESKYAYFDRTYLDYIEPSQKSTAKTDLKSARHRLLGKQVVTGLEFFDSLTESLLGTYEQRENIRRFQEYLSDTFFSKKKVTLIPRQNEKTVYVEIGYEKEKAIQHLGDGLQQLIIMMWPLFTMNDTPLFLFIEEPDLFLHPGYQRTFIEATMLEPDRPLYVFVTTHSHQFLDATLDEKSFTIYRCRKTTEAIESRHDPKFVVEQSVFGDRNLLHDLGVKPSSLLFANCTIWVEGITDRLYLRRFLDLVMRSVDRNFIENLHYAFVEYSGNNITHWSFLDRSGPDVTRICAKLLLVADKDTKKDKRHEKLRESLGDRFYLLNVSEIENLLSPKSIRYVINHYEKNLNNCSEFNSSDYRRCKLGRFIDEKILKDVARSKRYNSEQRRAYGDKSGTVKDKVAFCERALESLECTDDLTPEALELANVVFNFISQQNA